ncbi:arylsulfotransferase family protein [Nocardioides sp.]|uniref:arylsulfotransferase family protein n=1 Tax=Nocardioides sp. TaxID=35761 RepID=UPI00260C261B|nr:arylsulfotransferase family protein [Nocardioides sp.]
MTKPGRALVVVGTLVGALLASVPDQAVASAATTDDAPVHTLTVSGDGVAAYPAYDPSVERYGVTTTAATGGTVIVTASTSDPTGEIYVDGVLDADGSATVSGLAEGDEVSVFIVDAAGTARHSLVYLPAGFPLLESVTSTDGPLTPGQLMVTLTNFTSENPVLYQTVLDRQGVPTHVQTLPASIFGALDLKQQPDGGFSISKSTTTPGRTGQALVQLDDELQEVTRTEAVDLVNTDGHDSIVLPDGTVWLVSYEPDADPESALVHSIIQRIDPDGSVGFEWTSAPYVDETVTPEDPEYAHVNSIDLMADGDLLASFRGFSSVFKIATSAHDGFEVGDVVWKLGGLDSTFAIEDAEGATDSGPCAQHTARELGDGSILLFDNGSVTPMCADPADPDGDRVARIDTRILRFALDEETGTAVVQSSYAPGRFAQFAGSTQAVGPEEDRTLIGWAFSREEIASEIDADGQELWRLRDPDPAPEQRYFSYRTHLAEVPDATDPEVVVESPAPGEVFRVGEDVEASYSCTDRGGSSLQTCSVGEIDTSLPGSYDVEVAATDGAGNTTTVTRTYEVEYNGYTPPRGGRADAWVKLKGGAWVGRDVYGSSRTQRVTTSLPRPGRAQAVRIRLENDGDGPSSLFYGVSGKLRGFRVKSPSPLGDDVYLEPGERTTLRLTVVRTRKVKPGATLRLTVLLKPNEAEAWNLADEVMVRVRARR